MDLQSIAKKLSVLNELEEMFPKQQIEQITQLIKIIATPQVTPQVTPMSTPAKANPTTEYTLLPGSASTNWAEKFNQHETPKNPEKQEVEPNGASPLEGEGRGRSNSNPTISTKCNGKAVKVLSFEM
jgi:hypothetical protein